MGRNKEKTNVTFALNTVIAIKDSNNKNEPDPHPTSIRIGHVHEFRQKRPFGVNRLISVTVLLRR